MPAVFRGQRLQGRQPVLIGIAQPGLDLIAVSDERLALQPHARVERHRQVLDDDQDAGHQPIPSYPDSASSSRPSRPFRSSR